MKKVLILTAGFGDGHNAAARNLREALEQSSADVEVTVADLYERSYKQLNHIAKKAYLRAVRYAPKLWAGFFKLLDRSPWLADGRGLAAALAMGAIGVWCGTAFLVSDEANIVEVAVGIDEHFKPRWKPGWTSKR